MTDWAAVIDSSVFALQALTIVSLLLGAIPFLIVLCVRVWRREWRRVRLWVATPVLVLLGVFGLTSGLNALANMLDRERIFGERVWLGFSEFDYDSERTIHGDGYSMAIYALPEKIQRRFEAGDTGWMSGMPMSLSMRKDWRAEHWREAPIDPQLKRVLDFALSGFTGPTDPIELKNRGDEVREALSRPKVYYAYYVNDVGGFISNVDFYVVDLVRQRLYRINCNT